MSLTAQERLALGALALLLAGGAVARAVRGEPAAPGWEGAEAESPAALLARVEEGAAHGGGHGRRRPLSPGEQIDLNQAAASELVRLPGVGPALAERIVARRAVRPYRTLADLDSVPGVGPALLARLEPHVGLLPAPAAPARPRGPRAPDAAAPPAVLDLNRASAAELESLSGVGPTLAARIVEWRERHGRFRSVEDLQKVPGIGPATLARVRASIRVTP